MSAYWEAFLDQWYKAHAATPTKNQRADVCEQGLVEYEATITDLARRLAEAEAKLRRCGQENCIGLEVDGVRSWVAKERWEAAEARATAAEAERDWWEAKAVEQRDALKATEAHLERAMGALRLLDRLDPAQFFDMDEMANEAHRVASAALRTDAPGEEI